MPVVVAVVVDKLLITPKAEAKYPKGGLFSMAVFKSLQLERSPICG